MCPSELSFLFHTSFSLVYLLELRSFLFMTFTETETMSRWTNRQQPQTKDNKGFKMKWKAVGKKKITTGADHRRWRTLAGETQMATINYVCSTLNGKHTPALLYRIDIEEDAGQE